MELVTFSLDAIPLSLLLSDELVSLLPGWSWAMLLLVLRMVGAGSVLPSTGVTVVIGIFGEDWFVLDNDGADLLRDFLTGRALDFGV